MSTPYDRGSASGKPYDGEPRKVSVTQRRFEQLRRIFGGNVRRLRQASQITQAQLSDASGVEVSRISRLELGRGFRRAPNVIEAWMIAQCLGVGLDELFIGEPDVEN
jgi:DNA-binding XRE family transcriptional regulator